MSNNIIFLPYVTEDLSVSTETPPFDFCPDIDLATYNIYQGWVSASQYAHSLPYDRHLIRASIDSSDYQTAINAAGISGTLATNIVSCYAVITLGLPSGVPVGVPVYLTPVWDTNGVTFYHYFRPLPNWTTRYINIVFLMSHNGQDDYMVCPVQISMAPYNKLTDGTSRVIYPDDIKVYQSGVQVDELCTSGEVEIKFEVASAFTGVVTAIHERDGEFVGEWNSYESSNSSLLPVKLDSPILDIDVNVSTNTEYITSLDESNIESGDCFYFLFKANNGDPIACEDSFCVEVNVVVNQWGFLTVDWDSTLGVNAEYSFSYAYTDSNFQNQTVEWQTTDHDGSITEGIDILMPQGVSLTMSVTVGTCVYTYQWSILQETDVTFTDQYCTE